MDPHQGKGRCKGHSEIRKRNHQVPSSSSVLSIFMALKARLLQHRFSLMAQFIPLKWCFLICFFLSRWTVLVCSLVLPLSFLTHSVPWVFYLQVENLPLCYTASPEPPRQTGWMGKRGLLWPEMHHKSATSPISKILKCFKSENKHIYANQNARRFLQPLFKMPRHLFHFLKAPQALVNTTWETQSSTDLVSSFCCVPEQPVSSW